MKNPFWLALVAIIVGCGQQPMDAPSAGVNAGHPLRPEVENDAGNKEKYDFEWNDRNAEIYRFLLAKVERPTSGRICYLTLTPKSEWGENGNWTTIPAEDLKSFENASKYLPANEAYLQDHRVLKKGTDDKAWMKWISVKRWISETEVEVEEGSWCCPLGGGASTTIYEKTDDGWEDIGPSKGWVS